MTEGTAPNGQASASAADMILVASSSSSSVLSPIPNAHTDAAEIKGKGQKRARESNESTTSKVAKKPKAVQNRDEEEPAVKGVYCHQCRRKCADYLRCTKLRKKSGQPADSACNLAFCQSDLNRKYDTSIQAVKTGSVAPAGAGTHDSSKEYKWTCPHCLDTCEASQCRRKKGLEPLGAAGQDRRESVDGKVALNPKDQVKTEPAQRANDGTSSPSLTPPPINGNGPRPLSTTKTSRPSHVFSLASDSELSEPDAIAVKKQANGASSVKSKKAANPRLSEIKPTVKAKKPGKTNGQAQKANGKASDVKHKAKATSTAKDKDKKPRPKPEMKPEVPVDPPRFEKVDTRLGREEVEQRIMLREYLVRFRTLLSIPDRSLPPLDDFDRPLSEASVRSFAGAMLDLIKDELDKGDEDPEVIEIVEQYREELRYYADLARFANAFKNLTEPLGLKMPSVAIPAARGPANAQAIRALLDLDDDASPPAWADAGPSRRTAASRLPQPNEVVRMLLALAERTLSTPSIRTDLVWEAPENEARRVHLRQHKKENDRWDARKKKLAEARVLCKTAAATKANKEATTKETKEHALQLALANVNLRAALGQRALRHEPLGVDLDGRTYYCLHIRPIDDDSRPPLGWASGLLVWGIGVPPKPDAPVDEDEMPMMIERWCHFGKSIDVRWLVKWIDFRTRKAIEAARPRPVKSKATPKSAKATPNRKAAASSSKGTPTKGKQTQMPLNFTPKRTLEVVIPVQSRSTPTATSAEEVSSVSDLSSITSEEEDLLVHLAPEGYEPSWQTIEEEGKELSRKLAEVAEWLEVLEWKGMGEV